MKQHKKLLKRIISGAVFIVLYASLFVGVNTSNGKTTISDLEEKIRENEKAIEKAQKDILTKDSQMSLTQSEVLAAESEIAKFSEIIFEIENSIISKEEEITLTLIKLEETEQKQIDYYNHTKERIKVMYEYGSTEYLEVLLESKDTSDFFNRLEYLNKLVKYDQSMLDELDVIKASILDYENKLVVEKVELEKLKEENNANLNEVETLRVAKKKDIDKILNDKEMLFEQIKAMEEEQAEIDAMIQELLLFYADKEVLYGNGKVSWPLPGWSRISSSFGPRTHPVYGYASTHTGIDIPASYGTAIEAAASGQVIFAGWGNAYGNYILIDHGVDDQKRHIITQYAHCSSLLVVEGDVVPRGTIIAKVGSTGWSTGNHLHFGVQLGGTWINPLDKTDR